MKGKTKQTEILGRIFQKYLVPYYILFFKQSTNRTVQHLLGLYNPKHQYTTYKSNAVI